MIKPVFLLTFCSVIALTAGCSTSTSDLEAWVDAQQRSAVPRKVVVEAPVDFVPYVYQALTLKSPFDPSRLLGDVRDEGSAELPEWIWQEVYGRGREPLELIPRDAMVMVGSMQQGNRIVGLIKVEDLLYQVKAGDYLGQNFGKIERITETTIEIRELVPSPTEKNEWVIRPVTMQLQEAQS